MTITRNKVKYKKVSRGGRMSVPKIHYATFRRNTSNWEPICTQVGEVLKDNYGEVSDSEMVSCRHCVRIMLKVAPRHHAG